MACSVDINFLSSRLRTRGPWRSRVVEGKTKVPPTELVHSGRVLTDSERWPGRHQGAPSLGQGRTCGNDDEISPQIFCFRHSTLYSPSPSYIALHTHTHTRPSYRRVTGVKPSRIPCANPALTGLLCTEELDARKGKWRSGGENGESGRQPAERRKRGQKTATSVDPWG